MGLVSRPRAVTLPIAAPGEGLKTHTWEARGCMRHPRGVKGGAGLHPPSGVQWVEGVQGGGVGGGALHPPLQDRVIGMLRDRIGIASERIGSQRVIRRN